MPAFDLFNARPRLAIIELTSRCNLRCVYCAVNQSDYRAQDLGGLVEDWLDPLIRLHPREVQISGHGETTILPGWHRTARRLMERGLTLSLSTNMARPFGPEELDVLSRMAKIDVSCDTADPELFASIRRGGELIQLERNLSALVELCRTRSRQQPYIAISAVLTDLTAEGLPALALWAARQGVSGLFLAGLVTHAESPGSEAPLRRPAPVEPDRAARSIADVRRVAEELGLDLNVMSGLETVPRQRAANPETAAATVPILTRCCTDPWDTLFAHADGEVTLCCYGPPVGNLRAGSFDEAFRGERARRIRAGLLSGELDAHCEQCAARGWTSAEELARRVGEIQGADSLGELEELRARVYRLEAVREELLDEREQLRRHARNVEEERGHLGLHARNLEEEKKNLQDRIARLDRTLSRIPGMAIYRALRGRRRLLERGPDRSVGT